MENGGMPGRPDGGRRQGFLRDIQTQKNRWIRLSEEQAAHDGIAAGIQVGHPDRDATGDVPDQVDAILEAGERLGIENRAGGIIDHIDALVAASFIVVPIHGVEGQLVALAVGLLDVDAEAAGGIPGGGDPTGAADGGLLEGLEGRWSNRSRRSSVRP